MTNQLITVPGNNCTFKHYGKTDRLLGSDPQLNRGLKLPLLTTVDSPHPRGPALCLVKFSRWAQTGSFLLSLESFHLDMPFAITSPFSLVQYPGTTLEIQGTPFFLTQLEDPREMGSIWDADG